MSVPRVRRVVKDHTLICPVITKPLFSQPSFGPVYVNNVAPQLIGLKPGRMAVFRCDY